MKDITITQEQLKRELFIYLALLTLSFFMNVYAIIAYNGAWSELFTQLHVVFALSVFFYLLVALVRTLVFLARALIKRRSSLKSSPDSGI